MDNHIVPEFISISEFSKRTGLSRGTVYNEIERGNLPKPMRLTENRVAFTKEDVDAWLERVRAAPR